MTKKHKHWLLTILTAFALILSACQNQTDGDNESQESGAQEPGAGAVQTTDLNENLYRPVMRDGQYQPSQSRGITLRLNSPVNIQSFESGLLDISARHFPTDTHLFEEGQHIPSDVISSWLGRKSESNPDGLNPEDNGETASDARNPMYLESILEQDYYIETEEGLRLDGISIGLALNSVDYYQQESYGATYETEIPREILLEQGQAMAETIVQRIREVEDLKDIPIVIGLFEQAPKDDLAGGVMFFEGVSNGGSTTVDSWSEVNQSKAVLPLEGTESNEGTSFANFKAEVENFFPNLSSVTGVVEYQNNTPINMTIDITTQFYGEAEVMALSQHVKNVAEEYLPSDYPIEINIQSVDSNEAFLSRDTSQDAFDMHIFF